MSEEEVTVSAIKQLLDTAKRFGLLWNLRMATVLTIAPVTAIYDADTVAISMVSMIEPLFPGDRVYAISVPPAGNFIIGGIPSPALVGRVDSTSSSGGVGAETVVLTTPTITFKENHAYRVTWRGQTASSTANSTAYRVRQSALAGTLLNVFQFEFPASDSDTFMDTCYVNSSSNQEDVLVLTLQATAGTSNMVASTTNVRYLEVYDVGRSSDYVNAITI